MKIINEDIDECLYKMRKNRIESFFLAILVQMPRLKELFLFHLVYAKCKV